MVVIPPLCDRNSCRLKNVPQHDCQINYSTTTPTQTNNKKMSNRNAKKFISKAKVESLRAQNLFIQVWDYDAGFPGIQNDDYLGRCGFFTVLLFFSFFPRPFFLFFSVWRHFLLLDTHYIFTSSRRNSTNYLLLLLHNCMIFNSFRVFENLKFLKSLNFSRATVDIYSVAKAGKKDMVCI